MRIIIAILMMFFFNFGALAAADSGRTVDVKVYMSSTCPHCQKADAYLSALQQNYNWLKVDKFYIDKDKPALEAFYQQLQALQIEDFSVPSIFFCGSRWVGFDSDAHLGALLKKGLIYCHTHQTETGMVSKTITDTLNQWSMAAQIQAKINPTVSPFIMTLFSAFDDAFNPNSFFCLAGLLIYFISGKKRGSRVSNRLILAVILGVHLLQTQAFAFLQMMTPVMVGLGCLGVVLSLLDNYRSLAYSMGLLGWLLWLGVLLNFQQPAFINIPLIFFQWINRQSLTLQNYYAYLILFQVLYGVFWFVLLKFIAWLSTKSLFKTWISSSQWLVAGYGAISLFFLLFYREGLANFYLSCVILLFFGGCIFVLNRFLLRNKNS